MNIDILAENVKILNGELENECDWQKWREQKKDNPKHYSHCKKTVKKWERHAKNYGYSYANANFVCDEFEKFRH